MTLSKIAIAGCFVLSFVGVAAADEVRVETGGDQNVVVRPDDHAQRPHPELKVHEDHDRDWIRRHHHDDNRDPHVDIDVNR